MSTTTTTTQTAPLAANSHPVPTGFVVKISKKFTLVWNDFLKAFLVAALSAPVTEVLTTLQSGNLNPNWKAIGVLAVTSGASYLLKNYFSTTASIVAK